MQTKFIFRSFAIFAGLIFFGSSGRILSQTIVPQAAEPGKIVRLTLSETSLREFKPSEALGYGIDGADRGSVKRLFRPDSVRAIQSLALPRLSYRLRTELGVEAWHWNSAGTWSDPRRKQGYWTSAETDKPLEIGYGYSLPRRGTSADQANNNGYSRLTDGDPNTFWKSNPYLTEPFTGDPDETHPQWVALVLKIPTLVNAIRLHWKTPYAVRYRVEYCRIDSETDNDHFPDTFGASAKWITFPTGEVKAGRGGIETLRLCKKPIRVQFIRVWMIESSGSRGVGRWALGVERSPVPSATPDDKTDLRDRCGYALAEIGVGRIEADGAFRDAVIHLPNAKRQTQTFVSSTDPWHTVADRNPDTEQPGFSPIVRKNLHRGRPLMVSVGVAYDTPENAVNLLKTLRRSGIPVREVELGEEPDGQSLTPEDYGALYVRFARALHQLDPTLKLGGPSLQCSVQGWVHWPNAAGDRSWMRRFIGYLREHHALSLFQFFSFEWYPFDDFKSSAETQLNQNPALFDRTLARLRREGVSETIPWAITELGWSSYATDREVTLPGALLDAESIARFLSQQNGSVFFYGVAANRPNFDAGLEGATWGGLLAFLGDDDGEVQATLPTAYAMRLVGQEWMQGNAPDQTHALIAVQIEGDTRAKANLGAYALRRPDGKIALLLLNRDAKHAMTVRLPFSEASEGKQYSPAQYRWQANGELGEPSLSLPPVTLKNRTGILILPPTSITVIRGNK